MALENFYGTRDFSCGTRDFLVLIEYDLCKYDVTILRVSRLFRKIAQNLNSNLPSTIYAKTLYA